MKRTILKKQRKQYINFSRKEETEADNDEKKYQKVRQQHTLEKSHSIGEAS